MPLFGAPPINDKLGGKEFMKKKNKPEDQEQGTGRRNRHSNSFRDQIIRYLHDEKGFSWPKAERGFRTVFWAIGQAVRSGDVVELPGMGTVKSVVRRGPAQRRWRLLHNVFTGKKTYRVVPDFRLLRKIVFTPYQALDFTPPPPPPSPAEIEAQELAAELLGRAVDASVMERLQADGVDFRAHLPGAVLPGALLRRLRHLKGRGRQFQDVRFMDWAVAQLARAVADLYWI
jgi:nucleoid DNA-binding protein